MSEGKISPHEAGELDACFRAEASDLFGYACAVTRGDQALSHDLVQAAFEAAAVLGIAEKTASAHLYRVRRKLLLHLGADRPFDDGAAEGALP